MELIDIVLLLPFLAILVFAIVLNEVEHMTRRANRADLADRHSARMRAQEGIARHETRPWVDIDVEPRRKSA